MTSSPPSPAAPHPSTQPGHHLIRAESLAILMLVVVWVGALGGSAVYHAGWWSRAIVGAAIAAGFLLPVLVVFGLGLGRRWAGVWPAVVMIGCLALAFVASGRAEAAYDRASARISPSIESEALLVDDPVALRRGWRVEAKLGSGERVELMAYGVPGFTLAKARFGERIAVSGSSRSLSASRWARTRHVVATVTVERAVPIGDGPALLRWPDRLRGVVVAGAVGLPERSRALYLGLVLGDDRDQSLSQRARFRAAGLSHLLAVSGQNVAFVLLVAAPVLSRLPGRVRLVVTVVILAGFAVVTRAEPSVLRATVTAGIAAWAAMTGRQRSGLQVLSVAVMLLLLLDPFLARVIGFQLSVAASLGILLFAPTLGRLVASRRTLLRPLAAPLAITVAAQLGVSPLLVAYFGPAPLASLPANLAAGWAAGLVMTLGLTIGFVAGFVPSAVAAVLQVPARVLLWWIDTAASLATVIPAPRLGLLGIAAIGIVGLGWRVSERGWMKLVLGMSVALLVWLDLPQAPGPGGRIGPGLVYVPGDPSTETGAVLFVEETVGPASLDALLASPVRDVEIVVVERGDRATAGVVTALAELCTVQTLLAPPQHDIVGATRLLVPITIVLGPDTQVVVQPAPDGRRLQLELVGR